ncbi:MAG: aldehyde ferredoxin oxidoreductase [Rhodospirillales bacterium]|jgi:aldehyde:ferredoxin oxidoreductase|nr:aldehyde ferredoxin oxidoreductase [Rhodospirillales bacterium]MBT4041793.1 aldehyde ferredoxin oxidoreductase [Rhodospirillales bacterium]MBT4628477.1 aldehyde ferredoxin oxidoreductase [Rhodospirillales bacterium]MBT5351081.1 aldehyde ferredoxin oxidoreductase [Rhodospirillales bacterium]MBT5520727.1 aldehyde ferredoxin oxidoreductase [Rhodospirillales bacterium]
MRKYLHFNLGDHSVKTDELHGEIIAEAGRYLIARTLLESGVATVDPWSADNPLIFSAGPFAGTNFSNANRLSVGCKSPLTGGIKEANVGGTFAVAMGNLEIAGLTLHGASDDWTVIFIGKDNVIRFDDAAPYMGKGNIEAAKMLHEKYGKKISLSLCGPVGEYGGLLAGISFSDTDNRPTRLAARGGVGAVMGTKKVKAIVVEKFKMPPMHDLRKVMGSIKTYGKELGEQVAVQSMSKLGTAMVADLTNHIGGLPVRNFSAGRLTESDDEVLMLGGDHIFERNTARGGTTSHACMPGCLIKCSNVYMGEDGEEITSPLEYETICLLGSNCGLKDPDQVARLNAMANDLGIDTIELGATLGILMDDGQAEFGDYEFMVQAIEDIAAGNERGKLLAQGTARVGEHFGIKRLPVIKKQALSAYDPRVIEVTGVSMMLTAQGADHTTGNLPGFDCKDKSVKELAEQSFQVQINSAIADSTGLCLFGRTVTDTHHELIIDAINDAHNTELDYDFLKRIAVETLKMEHLFNKAAGFTDEDDELPAFFRDEALPPTNRAARLNSAEINQYRNEWLGL